MRTLLTILVMTFLLAGAQAQTKTMTQAPLPGSLWLPMTWRPMPNTWLMSPVLSKDKWHFDKYLSLSAGTFFYGGNNATSYIAAPAGVQLTRTLNNNLYAFTGAYITPVFFNVNRVLAAPNHFGGQGFRNGYGLSVNPGIEAGLMYINNDRTFSISGRVRMETYSAPYMP